MDYASFLKNVPLFASLKPADFADLANIIKVNKYKKGDTIFHQEDPGATLYIILSGQVKITINSPDGEEAILAVLTVGDFFGELSLLDQEPRSANVVAMLDTQTIILHRRDFLNFLSIRHELAVDMLAALSRRLREADNSLQDTVFLNLPARLAKRLLELGQKHGIKTDRGVEIGLRLTQQNLADMVGASRVAVNKQLNLFKIEGLIDMDKQHFTITRPKELGGYTNSSEKM
jgi:CRP/FNR family transcriptional regulator/CRP/FNR family cyclic AMP-dependent transcriptional regulator